MTFDDVLGKIKGEATDSRDLGTRFESMMLDFFRTDKHYKNRFGDRVWLWKKWAYDNKVYRPDEGN